MSRSRRAARRDVPLARAAPPSRRGFALEATLVVLVFVGAVVGLVATWVVTSQRASGLDYHAVRVQHAAEAGADAVMAQLETAMQDGVLLQTELDALAAPTLPGFVFERLRVRYAGAPSMRPVQSPTYKGLFALNQPVTIEITAHDDAGNRAGVVVSVNAQSIPLFQFGVFYEDDLEIHNGPRMDFAGWVHTNGNLYLSSDNTYFQSLITTPGKVLWRRKAFDERRSGVWINDAAGVPTRLGFDSESPADAHTFKQYSQRDFDGRLMTAAHGVSPLRLPLPAGVPARALVEPRDAGDDAPTREVKFAWKADWQVIVDAAALETPCASIAAGPARSGRDVPTGAACSAIFTGKRDAFHDGREETKVDVLDIDVAALRAWIAAAPGSRTTEILYVTFRNVPPGRYPAVRLVNGEQLHGRFTLATDRPLYVRGDFNTVGWQPTSLVSDAITFLSGAWSDANQQSAVRRTADAAGMRVNAAVAAGHSATPCDFKDASCSPTTPPALVATTSNYGGGLENFPRFLENWSSRRFTYRGSLVSLFQSRHAARRRWNWWAYYGAPDRDWQFDLRFQDPTQLPPGTPTVGSVLQTAFRPVY